MSVETRGLPVTKREKLIEDYALGLALDDVQFVL